MSCNFPSVASSMWVMLAMLTCDNAHGATPDVFRSWFTPTVIPTNFAGSVRFEAEITGGPSSVVFNYSGTNRLMFDNGSNGDLVAADNVWTCLFTTSEIFSKNTSNRVFHPFIGTCNPTNASAFNSVAEVWTPQIGIVPVTTNLGATNQETDYVVNYVVTKADLTNFIATNWAKRFYTTHGDKYDFLSFVHIAGVRGNRYHAGARNSVQGIGSSLYTNTASFGSAGRLQGYSVFPISSFYDGGGPGFNHETGHQWINFLSGTPYAGGVPHWPKGDIAINVMGVSLPGNVGGNYPHTFSPDGGGGYIVGPDNPTNRTTFNLMELYLLGLAAPAEVPPFFVLTNQNLNVTNGQVLAPGEFTLVSINDVIATKGARVPNSTNSQKTFRCATVILSEQLLDVFAMSFYDYFTRRAEAKLPHAYAEGLATGTSNPFYVATGGRAVLFSKIADDIPVLNITNLPNQDLRFDFAGKLGITYQPQRSGNLASWTNDGAPIAVTATNPPSDIATNYVRTPPVGTNQSYYRLRMIY